MITRIWHGWTTTANAEPYEKLLKEEVFKGIRSRKIHGFHGIRLLRRVVRDEVAVVPPHARALLSRFDARSQHYENRPAT